MASAPSTSDSTTVINDEQLDGQIPKEVCDSTAFILCRGDESSDDDEYVKTLRSFHFLHVNHVPLLQFKFIEEEHLHNSLFNYHQEYEGLIFTSVRSVTAVTNCLNNKRLTNWRDKWIFAVGPKTCTEIERQLGLKVTISNPDKIGSSQILAQTIVEMSQKLTVTTAVRLLMPCSRSAQDILLDILSGHGIQVIKLPAYETIASPDAQSRLLGAVQEKSHKERIVIVFFSPSNVKSVLPTLVKMNQDMSLPRIHYVAIGPTTQKFLEDSSLPVFCVSSKPDPCSLVDCIIKRLIDS